MLLEVKNISKEFIIERGFFKHQAGVFRALDNVSFEAEGYRTLGIVGESGSGKTTLAKIILGLIPATSGEVSFNPVMISNFRKDVQIVFQNPYNSLNPKLRIRSILEEPLIIHQICGRASARTRAAELLRMVGLDEGALERYPIEFSGGQRQRICIARALATQPKFIILDEPISSLDLTIQAQMLDLLVKLKKDLKLTYIFISHNLAVIKHIADSVLVMKSGSVIERGETSQIFNLALQPYTRLLLEAAKE